MRSLIVMFLVVATSVAAADSGSAVGSDAPAIGSAGSAAGSASPTPATGSAAGQTPRQICAAAMNADPIFADDIVKLADKVAAERRLALDAAQHEEAARHVATNERHVIIAYAAMWIVAAAFLLFLSRRQIALRREIAALRRDLDAATKEGA